MFCSSFTLVKKAILLMVSIAAATSKPNGRQDNPFVLAITGAVRLRRCPIKLGYLLGELVSLTVSRAVSSSRQLIDTSGQAECGFGSF